MHISTPFLELLGQACLSLRRQDLRFNHEEMDEHIFLQESVMEIQQSRILLRKHYYAALGLRQLAVLATAGY